MEKKNMYHALEGTISEISFDEIGKERREKLSELADLLREKQSENNALALNFICTHNSRRSHLCQIWASIAIDYHNVSGINCYSGGTEATAMFPVIAETLRNQGLEVLKLSEGKNPVYAIKSGKNKEPIITFSKKYEHPFNPRKNFIAVLTCDSADEKCPIVHGSSDRITVMYEDPKVSDGTEYQTERYLERSKQIANEMFYLFKNL